MSENADSSLGAGAGYASEEPCGEFFGHVGLDVLRDAPSLREKIEGLLRADDVSSGAWKAENIAPVLKELLEHGQQLSRRNEKLRSAELQLQKAHQRYFDLFHESPIGYVVVDRDFYLCQINQCALEMLNIDSASGKQNLGDFVVPEDQEIFAQFRRDAASPENRPDCELRLQNKQGQIYWVHLIGSLIIEPSEEQWCCIALINVTSEKQANQARLDMERQLQHKQKLEGIGLLAGGIAHDFNNMLVAVLGNADLALMETPSDTPVHGMLTEMKQAIIQTSGLCNQMLAYAGKANFSTGPVNLTELVKETQQFLQASIPKQITTEIDLAADLPWINGNATQIRQIIINLLINAAEAIGEKGGTIKLRTGTIIDGAQMSKTKYLFSRLEPDKPYVFLEVIDNGCGFDNNTREKLFEPFFTTKLTGRGLGLSAVIGIVKSHNGVIEVKSAPEQGTMFRVFFPVNDYAASPASENNQSATAVFQERQDTILVIDNEPAVLQVTRHMLESGHYCPITCSSGPEGIEVFRDRHDEIAAVLIDMTMPQMSGAEVFRELRKIDSRVPVIIYSGYDKPEAIRQIRSNKGYVFLRKPFELKSLLKNLSDVIAN